MKTNENLTLIQGYWDEAKTKLWYQYHVDQFGKKQGECKHWYENGQISFIGNYIDGKKQGKSKQWHPNGKINSISNFKKGEPDGVFKSWNENGMPICVIVDKHKKGEHGTGMYFKYEK